MLSTLSSIWDTEGPLPIAFDGDGTLWTGDVADRIWHALLEEQLVRDEARPALMRECASFELDTSGDVIALCTRLFQAYVDGHFPEERICEVQAWSFAGWTRAEIELFVDRILFTPSAKEPSLLDTYIGETCEILAAAKARGVPVFVVSASPAHVIERAVRPLGVSQVLGSRVLWSEDDRVLPDVERPICYGPGKVRALRRVLEGRPLLAAFGDNLFDLQMLQFARIGVMVRPKPRLLALPEAKALPTLAERPLSKLSVP